MFRRKPARDLSGSGRRFADKNMRRQGLVTKRPPTEAPSRASDSDDECASYFRPTHDPRTSSAGCMYRLGQSASRLRHLLLWFRCASLEVGAAKSEVQL